VRRLIPPEGGIEIDGGERMSTFSYAGGTGGSVAPVDAEALAADRASRRWRAIWRTHFYAGIFAAPFLVLMALTGLVILYTQPIHSLTQGDLRDVKDTGDWISFDKQADAVRSAYPDLAITAMTLPRNGTTSTEFGLDNGRSAFVNPYTGKVLGTTDPGGGIVGLSNRLHGILNNGTAKISLPAVSALFDGKAVMRKYVVGDMVLEILGCWAIVLFASGLYLWWPRKSRVADTRSKRSLWRMRVGKRGRARWRDLHAIPGVALSALLLITLVSGMAWSSYWSDQFSSVADKLTPGNPVSAPNSALATRADLDRLGNHIPWNTGKTVLPNSDATAVDPTTLPAVISLDTLAVAGTQEGMKPGYTIYYPENGKDDVGNPTFGVFTLSNSWPRKTGEAKDVYLDQFSGKTLSSQAVYGMGTVSRGMDTLVSTHMGTQLGIVSRIFMTMLPLLALWSVASAIVMYGKRRRKGSLGLPRRPRDLKMANRLIAFTVVLAIVYPLWGVTAFVVLMLDKFVIRKNSRLRRLFGQASPSSAVAA
jgi:uncharacterized iron-regulated membrane protein